MDLTVGKNYYIPRVSQNVAEPGKYTFYPGSIIRYEGKDDIFGREIVNMNLCLGKKIEYGKPGRVILNSDFEKDGERYARKLAILIGDKVILTRKILKPTKVSTELSSKISDTDRKSESTYDMLMRDRDNLERRFKDLDPEEKRILDVANNARENMIQIVMLIRVAEMIIKELRIQSIGRGQSARLLRRYEESILRTLPTQRVVDKALLEGTILPIRNIDSRSIGFDYTPPSLPTSKRIVTKPPVKTPEETIPPPETVSPSPSASPVPDSTDVVSIPATIPVDAPIPPADVSPDTPTPPADVPPDTPTPPADVSPDTPTPPDDVSPDSPKVTAAMASAAGFPWPSPSPSPSAQISEYIQDTDEPKTEQEKDVQRYLDEMGEEESKETEDEDIESTADEESIPVVEEEESFDEEEPMGDEYPEMDPEMLELSRRFIERKAKLQKMSIQDVYKIHQKFEKTYEDNVMDQKLESQYDEVSYFKYEKISKHPEYIGGFPAYKNAKFQSSIASREDFKGFISEKPEKNIIEQLSDVKDAPEFKLQNHQRYISKFLSSDTPYNSLLVYHEVGTGKTCMAVQVAEMYLAETGGEKKALIIAPNAVQPGFKREIFDVRKLRSDEPTNQCTGDIYFNFLGGDAAGSLERKFQNMVRSRYDMYGYGAFESYFEHEVLIPSKRTYPDNIKKRSEIIIQRISEIFGDRLLIIDEVHNIRDSQKKKEIIQYLRLIARFAYNTRLLFMSGTPMYNKTDEIIDLLNILRLNEGLPAIPYELVFEKATGRLLPKGEEIIAKESTGLVSYLRGENPLHFPFRLPPSGRVMGDRNERPKLDHTGKKIESDIPEGKDILPIVRVPVSKDTLIGKKYLQEIRDKSMGGRRLTVPGAAVGLKQKAVCVFPPDGNSGSEGLNDVFIRNVVEDRDRTKPYYKIRMFDKMKGGVVDEESRLFLHPERIHEYAPKIKEIIELARISDGIVMVFTENILGGAIPFAMALEQIGYTNYGGKPVLGHPKGVSKPEENIGINGLTKREHREKGLSSDTWFPGRYGIISGDLTLTRQRDKMIMMSNSKENKDGKLIKILIATEAVSEGVNFKNIREIHILESHFHVSLIDQVVGRGQRFQSHKALPLEKRNVTVYVWALSWDKEHPEHGKETADEGLFRYAEEKSVESGRVSRILKTHAFDCLLTHEINKRVGDIYEHDIKIIDSQKNEREYNFADSPGSKECDYQTECAIVCADKSEVGMLPSISTKGFIQEYEIRRETTKYMSSVYYTTLSRIVSHIRKNIPGLRKKIIEGVIRDMIVEETRILSDSKGIFIMKARPLGTEIVLSLEPTEITDARASYLERLSRIRRKPGYTLSYNEDIIEETKEDESREIYIRFKNDIIKSWDNITDSSPTGERELTQTESLMRKIIELTEGVSLNIWLAVYAEQYNDMKNPLTRRYILQGIAMEDISSSPTINMLRNEYKVTEEIKLGSKRSGKPTRVLVVNQEGSVDIINAETNEIMTTKTIVPVDIKKGFYTFRTQSNRKQPKRGDPIGKLLLKFQDIEKIGKRYGKGYDPDSNTSNTQISIRKFLVAGKGIVFGDSMLSEEGLQKLIKHTTKKDVSFEESLGLFTKLPKNKDVRKILIEGFSRQLGTYRAAIKSLSNTIE